VSLGFPILIGDIGGTNARFQLLENSEAAPHNFPHVKTRDHKTIIDAINETALKRAETVPKTIILAAAGPITPRGLNLTNCHWSIEPGGLLKTTNAQKIILFNDFDAQALALPTFKADDLKTIGNAKIDASHQKSTKVVLGPGTGLGVAGLLWAGDKWAPIGGEGGHVDLGPCTQREQFIWEHLDRFEGRVSAESILCGSGLLNLYKAICKTDGVIPDLTTPSEVSSKAVAATNDQALEALNIFCVNLGRLAGNLALTTMARGGVYLGGGIATKILPFLEKSGFRQAFEDKAPHSELIASIPTHVVTSELPALAGLSYFAQRPENFAIALSSKSWSA